MRRGIVAGLNGYNAGEIDLSDNRGRWGGDIGVKVELPLSMKATHWYIDTEAKLRLLRWHEKYSYFLGQYESQNGQENSSITPELKRDAYYLQIPIHIGRKWRISENGSLFADAGSYVAFGLFGKSHATGSYLTNKGENAYKSYSYNTFDHSYRFEWGVGVKLGTELYKHYQIGISYDYGVTQAHGNDRNANFTFVIGYMF